MSSPGIGTTALLIAAVTALLPVTVMFRFGG